MAGLNKLSAIAVERMKAAGIYADGGGLCLQIVAGTRGVGKSWILRYRHLGKARAMGLGAYPGVGLADARDSRNWARGVLNAGKDPIEERNRKQDADASRMTFAQCAARYISAHEVSWRNPKHRQQWANTLATYAGPVIGGLPVDEVDVDCVYDVLHPIWANKPETASRLRGRIEVILDWARVSRHREGENPALEGQSRVSASREGLDSQGGTSRRFGLPRDCGFPGGFACTGRRCREGFGVRHSDSRADR